MAALFEPFVLAMQASLGHETVLPLGWQSIRGKKGHVTGAFQTALLARLQPYLRAYRHVVVLGDAEYCNRHYRQ